MTTAWHGKVFALLALCERNSLVTNGVLSQRANSSLKAIWCGALMLFVVTLNEFLNKQSSYGWFETQWRWCDVIVMRCSWSQCVLCWCWPLLSFGLTYLPPGQNGHHFADDVFRSIFVNEKFCILVKISLKFVPKGPIDNNPAQVQIMVWCRLGDKPLSEPMLTWFTDAYMRH